MAYNWTELEARLIRELARTGPTGGAELCARLQVSRSTFRRLIAEHTGNAVLTIGRARATQYAARYTLPSVGDRVPVYRINRDGRSALAATLHAILPAGAFYCESSDESIPSGTHEGLPFFLAALRPAGFLGRLVPARHPELGLPQDILNWSAPQCLQYLTRFGWNLPGDFIVGDEALSLFIRHTRDLADAIRRRERADRYAELAENVLEQGEPGSSAAGERPKFLATLEEGPTSVLVKFSPPWRSGDAALREVDLLIAEACAHQVLERHRMPTAQSEIVSTEERVFLQVVRFDRIGFAGRRGALALDVLDAEYVGAGGTWSHTATQLCEQRVIDEATRNQIQLLELFGRLIGNSDMHLGNLSLLADGVRIESVAPLYDMLPMYYAPRHGEIHSRRLDLPEPHPVMATLWQEASQMALAFWHEVAAHDAISAGFRAVAVNAGADVAGWRTAAERLPRLGG